MTADTGCGGGIARRGRGEEGTYGRRVREDFVFLCEVFVQFEYGCDVATATNPISAFVGMVARQGAAQCEVRFKEAFGQRPCDAGMEGRRKKEKEKEEEKEKEKGREEVAVERRRNGCTYR